MSVKQLPIQVKRETKAYWAAKNPVLLAGEFGYETDTKRLKVGDGISKWTAIDYIPATAEVETDPVFSAWLSSTPPLYSETDPISLHIDQSTPQYIVDGKPIILDEPSLTYSSGVLTRIDYPNGYYKEFSYNLNGTLASINLNGEHTKTFTYNLDGTLASIGVT